MRTARCPKCGGDCEVTPPPSPASDWQAKVIIQCPCGHIWTDHGEERSATRPPLVLPPPLTSEQKADMKAEWEECARQAFLDAAAMHIYAAAGGDSVSAGFLAYSKAKFLWEARKQIAEVAEEVGYASHQG